MYLADSPRPMFRLLRSDLCGSTYQTVDSVVTHVCKSGALVWIAGSYNFPGSIRSLASSEPRVTYFTKLRVTKT